MFIENDIRYEFDRPDLDFIPNGWSRLKRDSDGRAIAKGMTECFNSRMKLDNFFALLQEKDGMTRRNQEEFYYIRYGINSFLELMWKHMERRIKSFIDVGCGGGDKLALMKEHFPRLKVYGVEHDPAMAAWAATVGDKVWCADAFTIDYSKFDLIYAYWPISNRKLMDELIARIMKQKKPTAKFLLVGYHDSMTYRMPKPVRKVKVSESRSKSGVSGLEEAGY